MLFIICSFLIIWFREIICFILWWGMRFVWFFIWRFWFLRKRSVWIKNRCYLVYYWMKIRPSITLFFREKESIVETDLKRTNLRVYYIFVCIRINVFILGYLERNQIVWYHISYYFKLRVSLCDHFWHWTKKIGTFEKGLMILSLIMVSTPAMSLAGATVFDINDILRWTAHGTSVFYWN